MARRPTDSPNWGGARVGSGRRRSTTPQRLIHVQIPPEMHARLAAAAAKHDCSVSSLVRMALVAFLE